MSSSSSSSSNWRLSNWEEEGKTLYDVLGVEKTAALGEIKKAYYRLALKCHPDHCHAGEGSEEYARVTEDFQALALAYEVLGDGERRKAYDEAGVIGEDDLKTTADWRTYWEAVYEKVTAEDIEAYSKQYKGSALEREDLLSWYRELEGDVDAVLEHVVLAEVDDLPRFREIVAAAVRAGEAEALPAWEAHFGATEKEKKRFLERKAAAARKEAAEAEALSAELKIGTEDGLRALILKKRAAGTASFLESLEQKYAKPQKKAKAVPPSKKSPKRREPEKKRKIYQPQPKSSQNIKKK